MVVHQAVWQGGDEVASAAHWPPLLAHLSGADGCGRSEEDMRIDAAHSKGAGSGQADGRFLQSCNSPRWLSVRCCR